MIPFMGNHVFSFCHKVTANLLIFKTIDMWYMISVCIQKYNILGILIHINSLPTFQRILKNLLTMFIKCI